MWYRKRALAYKSDYISYNALRVTKDDRFPFKKLLIHQELARQMLPKMDKKCIWPKYQVARANCEVEREKGMGNWARSTVGAALRLASLSFRDTSKRQALVPAIATAD